MNSKETINGVADETDDWAEGLAKLKNQVMVAAEPIATTLFDALNKLVPLIEKAVPPLQKMADSFANMPQGVRVAIVAFAALLALVGPLLQGIAIVIAAWPCRRFYCYDWPDRACSSSHRVACSSDCLDIQPVEGERGEVKGIAQGIFG